MKRKVVMIGAFSTEPEEEQHFYGYSPAGSSRFHFIYQLFIELGYEVSIISTFLSCHDRFFKRPKRSVWRKSNVFRPALLSNTLLSVVLITMSTIFYLRSFLSRKKVDYIYIYNPYVFTGLPALYAKRAFGTKIILDYEDLVASEAMTNPIYRNIMKRAESWILKRIDACVACAGSFEGLLKPGTPFLILRGIEAHL